MAGISDLPMLHDIDADYSPQYVKPACGARLLDLAWAACWVGIIAE